MSAILMRVRSEVRARWRSLATLAVVLGIASGVVMAAAAGARRTTTAYPRFLDSFNNIDAGGTITGGFGFAPLDPKKVAALPDVRNSVIVDGFFFLPRTASGRITPIGQGAGNALGTTRQLRSWARYKLLDGHDFDPTDPHQILVGYGTSRGSVGGISGVPVRAGDRVVLRFLKRGKSADIFGQAGGPRGIPSRVLTRPFVATVTGIIFKPGDVGDNSYGDVYFTPAFDRLYRTHLAISRSMYVRLRHGDADVPTFLHRIASLAPGANVAWGSSIGVSPGIQRSTRPQAVALLIFAATSPSAICASSS